MGYGTKINKRQVLLSGLLMAPVGILLLAGLEFELAIKTNQTTNPQSCLHVQHQCSHFFILLERGCVFSLGKFQHSIPSKFSQISFLMPQLPLLFPLLYSQKSEKNNHLGISRLFQGYKEINYLDLQSLTSNTNLKESYSVHIQALGSKRHPYWTLGYKALE